MKADALVSLEGNLFNVARKAFKKSMAFKVSAIAEAVAAKDEQLALDLIAGFDLSEVASALEGSLEFYGMSAIYFGAGTLSGSAKTSNLKALKKKPTVVAAATQQAMAMLSLASETLQADFRAMADSVLSGKVVEAKADKPRIITDFVSFVEDHITRKSENRMQMVSSLHTTRLASMGFLVEARFTSTDYYAINEINDSRRCPVCSHMHGRVFPVVSTYSRLDQILRTTDPEQLKSISPWPKQDKESIQALRAMTTQELIDAGITAPPFHPLCRGILVHTTGVPVLEDVNVSLSSILDVLLPRVTTGVTLTTAASSAITSQVSQEVVDAVLIAVQEGMDALDIMDEFGISFDLYAMILAGVISSEI